ncbi:MAG TPA: hypothetical protein VIW73_08955 [Candidatus Cybelea sp.]
MRIAAGRGYYVAPCTIVAMLTGCAGHYASGVLPSTGGAPFAVSGNRTFHYTGGGQPFTVPKGVTRLAVVARGGAGAGGIHSIGGKGGRVYAIIPVTPGEKLRVFVGGAGTRRTGGFNGGADGGGRLCGVCPGHGGGGASDIRLSDKISERILIAGGGGGGGGTRRPGVNSSPGYGGKGGGSAGGSGGEGSRNPSGGGGGLGGTQTRGGTGGAGGFGQFRRDRGYRGKRGLLGDGGMGGAPGGGYSDAGGGGGGGGGYYGGGGGGGGGSATSAGSSGGGGGGGSSYAERNATHVHMWQGWKNASGDGLIVISWQ